MAILGSIWDAPGLPSQSVPLPSHFFTTRKVSVLLSNSQIFLQNVVFSAVTRIYLRLFTVCYFQFVSSQHHSNPLIFSGFFFSVPLSVPLLAFLRPIAWYSEIQLLRPPAGVFDYPLIPLRANLCYCFCYSSFLVKRGKKWDGSRFSSQKTGTETLISFAHFIVLR